MIGAPIGSGVSYLVADILGAWYTGVFFLVVCLLVAAVSLYIGFSPDGGDSR